MYEIVIASSGRRSLKKLPKKFKQRILGEVKYIGKNPYWPQRLSGLLHSCYSYHFT